MNSIEEEGIERMIEIIQETEKTEEKLEAKLPKNIRQIGNPEKDFRIYMEDYVYTYLHPAQIHGIELGIFPRLLILLGEINHFSNRSCAFISGAIQVENSVLSEELPELNEETWRKIHTEIKKYFENCEIVGWVLDIPGNTLEINEEIERIHRKNFSSKYQFFFLMDSKEREEAFYMWKEGKLARKEGYFIYYEKNPQMQEYMISRRETKYGGTPEIEEVNDQAAKNYRAMMLEKKEHSYKRHTRIFSYLISTLMVVVLCSVSVLLLGNIHRMENMEQAISVMSTGVESTEQEEKNISNQVAVETISGNVLPVEEQQENSEAENTEAAKPENEENGKELHQTEQATEIPDASVKDEQEISTDNAPAQEKEQNVSADNASAEQPAMTDGEVWRAQGYYIVQQGDTLEQICYKVYQTYAMLDKLCEVNGITDENTIFIGQKITLP